MKILLTFIACLITASVGAQLPPFLRHGFTTNIPNVNQFSGNAFKNGARITNGHDFGTFTSDNLTVNNSLTVDNIEVISGPVVLQNTPALSILRTDASKDIDIVVIGSGLSFDGTTLDVGASATNGFVKIQSGAANLLKSTNETVFGSLNVSNSAGNTISTFAGNIADYAQVNVVNSNTSAGASSDIVATAGHGTDTNYFIDMGINGPAGGGQPFTNGGHAYLYSMPSNNLNHALNLGAIGSNSSVRFYSGAPMVSGGITNPVERMRIDTNGNVGIGTNAPGAKLDVNGSVAIGDGSLTSGSLGLFFNDDPGTGWYRNGANQWTWATGGNTPNLSLISSLIRINGAIPVAFSSGNSTTSADVGISRGAAGKLYVGNGGSADFSATLITTSIGIGTTSPQFALDVVGQGKFSTGISSTSSNGLPVFQPTLPTSPGSYTNTLSKNVTVYVGAGVVTAISMNGTTLASGLTLTGLSTFLLQTNEYITVTYTGGAPTLSVKPL